MREFDTVKTRRILSDSEPPKSDVKLSEQKISDGFVLFYVKDGEIFPVGLTKDQAEILPIAIGTLGKVKVFIDKPQGEAYSLLKKGDEK